jgi:hypothetical protein
VRATLCVMVFVIGAISYADTPVKPTPKEQAQAALTLARSQRLKAKGECLPLLAAEAQSRYTGLPLVVWIGIDPPANLEPMPPAIHARAARWNGSDVPRVVMTRGGESWSLPADEVQRDPVAAVMTLVEMRGRQ